METNNDLLLQHLRHYYIDSRDNLQCNVNCQRSHLCFLRNWAYDGHYRCINDVNVQPAKQPKSIPKMKSASNNTDTNTDSTVSGTATSTTIHSHPLPESTTTSRATPTHLSSIGLLFIIIITSVFNF